MSDERDATTDQPMPEVNDRAFVQDLVIDDIEDRKQFGINKYGTALQSGNGRDMLQDAYEEVLDLAIYLRGMKDEDHHLELELQRVRAERNALIRACVELAAPLGWATDGTVHSAKHHITGYVRELEAKVAKPSKEEIIRALEEAMDERFLDGESVFEYVLASRPDLAERLRAWMERKR